MSRSMRAIATILMLAIQGTTTPSRASDEESQEHTVAANVNLTSNYVFRGQSQTDNGPAMQGGIDYSHESGFFAGLWVSTIDFNDPQSSPAEIDVTLGYSHNFSEATSGSIAAAYYWYPDSSPANYEYLEFIATLTHDLGPFALSGEITYAPNYSSETGTAVGVTGGLEVPMAPLGIEWLSASGHIGHQWVDDNFAYGTPDWLFYDLGLTATFSVFALDLRYTGTDIARGECFGGTKLCDSGVVLSLTANVPIE